MAVDKNSSKFMMLRLVVVLDIIIQVRSAVGGWTIWYNVDTPFNMGDDETYDNIRNHDYLVCGDSLPLKAVCRVANDGLVFDESDWKNKTSDFLIQPCTSFGIQCINNDQPIGKSCQDYEIRFYCPHDDIRTQDESNVNYGVIALASGLSVMLPLMCVCIVQCIKQYRIKRHNDRQRLARQIYRDMNSEEINPRIFDAPPTYDSIFTNNNTVRSELTNREQQSTEDRSRDNAAFVHENETENNTSEIYQISRHVLPERNMQNNHGNVNSANHSQQTPQPSRFPGMHLSIFDLSQNGGELTTPPPTYGDALEIIGEIPPKYSDISSVP